MPPSPQPGDSKGGSIPGHRFSWLLQVKCCFCLAPRGHGWNLRPKCKSPGSRHTLGLRWAVVDFCCSVLVPTLGPPLSSPSSTPSDHQGCFRKNSLRLSALHFTVIWKETGNHKQNCPRSSTTQNCQGRIWITLGPGRSETIHSNVAAESFPNSTKRV